MTGWPMSAKKKSRWTKTDLDKIRSELTEKRAELLGDVTSLEDQALKSTGDDVSVDHMADHGSDSFEQDQTIGLLEREREALRMIQTALGKIQDGEYGICEDCDGDIPKARLKALPYARLCIDCQMAEEQNGG